MPPLMLAPPSLAESEVPAIDRMTDDQIDALPPVDRQRAMVAYVAAGVHALVIAARAWASLARTNPELLPHARGGLLTVIERLANRQVLPELIGRFAYRTALLPKLARYPERDQRRLAAGEMLDVAVFENGRVELRRMLGHQIEGPQADRVFGPDGIRSFEEQSPMLHAAVARTAEERRPTTSARLPSAKDRKRLLREIEVRLADCPHLPLILTTLRGAGVIA